MILVEFYYDFCIIYGKTKYGFTIVSGFVHNNQFNLHKSFLICFDRKDEVDMPKNILFVHRIEVKNIIMPRII